MSCVRFLCCCSAFCARVCAIVVCCLNCFVCLYVFDCFSVRCVRFLVYVLPFVLCFVLSVCRVRYHVLLSCLLCVCYCCSYWTCFVLVVVDSLLSAAFVCVCVLFMCFVCVVLCLVCFSLWCVRFPFLVLPIVCVCVIAALI